MKVFPMSHHRAWLKFLSVLTFVSLWMGASAQITTTDCESTYSYCTLDTVTLAPSNTVLYTNFVWYANSVAPANAINAGNAASFNVDPARLGSSTIYVSAPGGTYILTSEYATPAGCATKNDTLVINFIAVPDLATVPDTICASAGNTADLSLLVTDNNGVAGPVPVWYPTLADAQAQSNALASTVVSPASTTRYYVRKNTTATDAENESCYDIDSVQVEVRCLSLGNVVWYDTDNDGVYESGEAGIENVAVELFLDADENGLLEGAEQVPYASTSTDGSGQYLFQGLPEGKYFVGIPASELGAGGELQHLYSSGTTINGTGVSSETTAPGPDAAPVSDTDDNGQYVKAGFYTGGVLTQASAMLNYQDEPAGETPDNSAIDDEDDNLTVDFGFYGMSLGSLVFMDTDNSGAFSAGDMGVAGVPVNLYAADGTTLVATTTTDAGGQYLFTGLAAGQYIVGVDTTVTALDNKESSDDGPNAGTPTSHDNDDNGVATSGDEVRSNVFTLTPGGASTGEGDQAETGTGMSDPSVTDNPNTPDNNSELHVDFGFKPTCPDITSPQGAQTICAGDAGSDLGVDISVDSMVAFVRFDAQQTGNAMYSGGTQIGSDVDPTGAGPFTATYAFNTADFPNASNTTPDTFYVYGIFANPPADPTCRPYQEIRVIVNPLPTAADAALTECENGLGSGEGDFTLTDADAGVLGGQAGMTVTYHELQADAENDVNALSSPYSSGAATIYARVENVYGCFATSEVTLNVDARPDFTLGLPTTCPGDEPTVTVSNLTNGDAIMSLMQLNTEGFEPYQMGYVFTTADGLVLGANNTVTVRNEDGCETAKAIAVPLVTPLVCPPVNVNVIRNGE